jgi:hypothetical protein
MTILMSSSWTTFHDCVAWRSIAIAPPCPNMGKTLLGIASHIYYHQMDIKLQAYDLLKIFSFMHYHGKVPNPT